MMGPFDRRSAACLINGYYPATQPQNGYDGGYGYGSGSIGFKWGDKYPFRQNGEYFPNGASDLIKKIKVRVTDGSTPDIKFWIEVRRNFHWNPWFGYLYPRALQYMNPWSLPDAINARVPNVKLSPWNNDIPWPEWPADKEYIPTTEVKYLQGYSKRMTTQNPITQIGWWVTEYTSKITGAPYNSPPPGPWWPEFSQEGPIAKPMGWSPADDGYAPFKGDMGSDPEYWWYFKVTGEDIGADKVNTIQDTGGFVGSGVTIYARDGADSQIAYTMPTATADQVAAAVHSYFLYAYTPDKTASTSPFRWQRNDLEIRVFAGISGSDCSVLKNDCWYKDADFKATIHYDEGTCEMDLGLMKGEKEYPSFSGGSAGQSEVSGKLVKLEQGIWPYTDTTFSLGGPIKWENLSPGTYRRITDVTVSLS